jgi:hypothetical protein
VETVAPDPEGQEASTEDRESPSTSGGRRLSRTATRLTYLSLLVSFLTPIIVALIAKI